MRRVSKKSKAAEAVDASKGKVNLKRKAAATNQVEDALNTEAELDVKHEDESATTPKKDMNGTASTSQDDSDVESYEIEAILNSRVRHGKQQFKIRWKGYGPADDTWEDEENMDSPDLIAAFLRGTPENGKKKTAPKTSPKKTGPKRTTAVKTKAAKKAKVEVEGGEDKEWEVSKIVDYVELKDGTRQFLVRWKGFSAKDNTWEPESNLNCQDLIQKFLALREEPSRETREVRKQVFKYNPELTKRQSHRSRNKKRVSYVDLE